MTNEEMIATSKANTARFLADFHATARKIEGEIARGETKLGNFFWSAPAGGR